MSNLNLKNIDDLVYLEGTCFENNKQEDLKNISSAYLKKLNKNKKQLKNNKSLFIYDYRPPLIDFNNSNWQDEAPIYLDNPAIQPHDSKLNSINLDEKFLIINGFGSSYMNYENYEFAITFNGFTNLSILESSYSKFKKNGVVSISLEDLNKKLGQLSFREVFLDESETLRSQINFVFIDYTNEDIAIEKRNIIVITFEYDSASVSCDHIPVENKISKKF